MKRCDWWELLDELTGVLFCAGCRQFVDRLYRVEYCRFRCSECCRQTIPFPEKATTR